MVATKAYRDQIYMIKDILLTLAEYGELNQTTLVSYCGLNLKKHRHVLDQLESQQIINRFEQQVGKRTIAIYKPTIKGMEFCKNILDPYEEIFPRKTDDVNKNNYSLLLLA